MISAPHLLALRRQIQELAERALAYKRDSELFEKKVLSLQQEIEVLTMRLEQAKGAEYQSVEDKPDAPPAFEQG